MSTTVIVSYDGSDNDDDGLTLASQLKGTGASLELAYVRHSRAFGERREELAQFDAERRLDLGATRLGEQDIPKHVLIAASTPEGLLEFAQSHGAAMIVFGSEYRTPPGRTEPGASATYLLEHGSVAVAVAAAGVRIDPQATIASIRVLQADGDDAAQQTADSLAAKLGATVSTDPGAADLIVVGSAPTVAPGRIGVSGATRSMLDASSGSVLVVPRGTPVLF